jgi:hypothetical protein
MGDLGLFIAGVLVTIPAASGIAILILAAIDLDHRGREDPPR